MTTAQSTNTALSCAWQTISITYEKKPLSLDAGVTSAYVCPNAQTGYIRVRGINGTGNYSYELRALGGSTLLDQNNTGVFTYGSAGQSYTVRVIDASCGTSFGQDVTLLDLSKAQIAYSESPDNVLCEGQTLRLHCLPLGITTYSWTGPNGWASNEQNPVIPDVTLNMSGAYTVTVTPEGCGAPMTQSVPITVSPCMAIVNPHLRVRVQTF
jgi:hypothetical protein